MAHHHTAFCDNLSTVARSTGRLARCMAGRGSHVDSVWRGQLAYRALSGACRCRFGIWRGGLAGGTAHLALLFRASVSLRRRVDESLRQALWTLRFFGKSNEGLNSCFAHASSFLLASLVALYFFCRRPRRAATIQVGPAKR